MKKNLKDRFEKFIKGRTQDDVSDCIHDFELTRGELYTIIKEFIK